MKPSEVKVKIRRKMPTATTLIRKVAEELKKAGYKRVYLEPVEGAQEVKVIVELSGNVQSKEMKVYAL
ncbi:MAG: hypothetical protein NZ902_00900 [Acidilobaceae archaeon]|nr:hypothetical protein [Acidilobaceae archaeon]MCX8165387.1 hypothetical protein [Acidilobaceae archaeon]MDW7973814.1 hypothetical protein [Sulfolobales archaeon]